MGVPYRLRCCCRCRCACASLPRCSHIHCNRRRLPSTAREVAWALIAMSCARRAATGGVRRAVTDGVLQAATSGVLQAATSGARRAATGGVSQAVTADVNGAAGVMRAVMACVNRAVKRVSRHAVPVTDGGASYSGSWRRAPRRRAMTVVTRLAG